ncbi:MAG: amino acid ABC transporter permease [Egibacteraceae bacterium]
MTELVEQFFDWDLILQSLPGVIRAFRTNVSLFMVAEGLVLVWALILALLRLLPGRAGAPLRWLAIAYIDFFRALPALVVIFLVGFGLPQTGLPLLRGMSLYQLAVLALTLVYGAYVAEVYRAGIESVHAGQVDAARALGLSGVKTMRFVVLPQAVRRVIPPLFNDFISLQKDTALIGVLGVVEGFRQAQIVAGQRFNASPYVGLALCFIVITLPLTRVTDYLIKRDQRRTLASRA